MSPDGPRPIPVARVVVPAGGAVDAAAEAAARRSLRAAANILIAVGALFSIGFLGALCRLPEGETENLVFAILLPLVAVPALVGGIGLRRGRGRGRAAALVAFCLLLPAVPVGTAVGAVGLVLLSRGKGMGGSQA